MKIKFFTKTILILAVALSAAQPANSQQLLKPLGISPETAAVNAEVILSEDFSKFTSGSEETPDATNIADRYTGAITTVYMQKDGWTGAAIYQAGGVCAISTGTFATDDGGSEVSTGYLMSPEGNYAGDLTITFRARIYDSTNASDVMNVILVSKNKGILENTTVTVTPEWKNFEVKMTKGEFTACMLEFFTNNDKVFFDDLKVTSVQTSIIPPAALSASNYTVNGFTANWNGTADAEKYLLSVFKMDVAGATHTESFEGESYPAGWTIDVSKGAGIQSSNEGFSGSKAIVFDATDDIIEMPYSKEPLVDYSFFAKTYPMEDNRTQLQVETLEGEQWYILGVIDMDRIDSKGEIIHLGHRMTDNTHQVRLRMKKHDDDFNKVIQLAIDEITYQTEPKRIPIITDKELTTTSYAVTGLEPESDYSYSVKAKNATYTSAPSNDVVANGLVYPTVKNASNVTETSYTANWEASPKAEGYYVQNYEIYTAPADEEKVILHEDFSKVTNGTIESPEGLYNMNGSSLDVYTQNPGWMGSCNYTIAGMMGAQGYFYWKGLLQTPTMDLSANGGKFKVEITAMGWSGSTGDNIVVQAGESVYQKIPVTADNTLITTTLEFDCGTQAIALLIYTTNGTMFMVDEIKVFQNVTAGTQVLTEKEVVFVDGHDNTSYTFTNLKQEANTVFGYRVFAYRNYRGNDVLSLSNELRTVDLGAGVDDVRFDQIQPIVINYNEILAIGAKRIIISDMLGHLVANAESEIIDLSKLAGGVYIATVQAENGQTQSCKFVKK